jgi:hypothetical protein
VNVHWYAFVVAVLGDMTVALVVLAAIRLARYRLVLVKELAA